VQTVKTLHVRFSSHIPVPQPAPHCRTHHNPPSTSTKPFNNTPPPSPFSPNTGSYPPPSPPSPLQAQHGFKGFYASYPVTLAMNVPHFSL